MIIPDEVDYSLYLVTGRELLPPGKDYYESLEQSLQGGVTVVQIREKKSDTGEFIEIAQKSKAICDLYGVPLIVNDRVDIALAIKARGVHLGQSDMPVALARQLLSPGSLIGTSCNNAEEITKAIRDGADYIGIGAVFGTLTKNLTSPIIGVRNVGPLLSLLDGTGVKAVAIGGIKRDNLLRMLYGTTTISDRTLDGVAVVSEIAGSQDPRQAAEDLRGIINAFRASRLRPAASVISGPSASEWYIEQATQLIGAVRLLNPLVHQITNNVVATQSANITLALGASPIMATAADEMEDLSRIFGASLINIGTLTPQTKAGMLKAGKQCNALSKPVVLDPVGMGASSFRKSTINDLLDLWQPSVIKGNAGELAALAGSTEVSSKGVDSVGSGFKDPAVFVKALAKKEHCVIVLTGPTDYISDGDRVVALENGDPLLGRITGSGCVVGSCIASCCATASAKEKQFDSGRLSQGDIFLGAIAGILVITIAAELAAKNGAVRGPGTFLPALIDELANLQDDDIRSKAKIRLL